MCGSTVAGRLRKVRLRLGSGSAASPRGSVAFEHFDLALQAGAYARATRWPPGALTAAPYRRAPRQIVGRASRGRDDDDGVTRRGLVQEANGLV